MQLNQHESYNSATIPTTAFVSNTPLGDRLFTVLDRKYNSSAGGQSSARLSDNGAGQNLAGSGNRAATSRDPTPGHITEDELAQTLFVLISGSQKDLLDISYSCYDPHGVGYITREELLGVFVDSWLLAWRMVSEVLDAQRQKRELPSHEDLASFAAKSREKLRKSLE